MRKRQRQKYSITIELHEKILVSERIKILKEHITKKYKDGRSKLINCITQEIREHVENRGKTWELKRKLNNEENNEGIKLKNRLDIQEEYTKYYKTLLKSRYRMRKDN